MRRTLASVRHPVTAGLVHRIDPLGVLLDGWWASWSGQLVFEASLTSDRVFPRGPGGSTDLMSLTEVVRQAALAAAHLETGLRLDSALAMQELQLTLERPQALASVGRLRATVRVSDVQRDEDGDPLAMRAQVAVLDRGRDLGHAEVTLAVPLASEFATQEAQRAGHWRSGLPRLRAADTGCDDADDVLLSAGPVATTWRLAVDTTRVRHFDHAVNHVPGMVLLDACLQAWRATDGPVPTRLRATFLRYTLLDRPTWISRMGDGTGVDEPGLVVTQGDDTTTMVGLFAADPHGAGSGRPDGPWVRGQVGRLLALSRPGRTGPRA